MGRIRGPATTALVVLMLVELLRVAFPSIGWYLRDTAGVGTYGLVPYALGPFALAFLAPLVARLVTARGMLVGGGLVLAGLRVAEQISVAPRIDLWLSLGAVTVALWLLSILAARPGFGVGVLLGIAADTAIRGVTGTLDLSWIEGPGAEVAVVAIAVALAGLLVAEALQPLPLAPPRGLRAAAHVAVGPVLLAHLLILSNQGWVAEQTGLGPGPALALLLAALLLGVAAASLPSVPVVGAIGALLVALSVAGATTVGPLFAALLVLGGSGSGLLLGAVSHTTRAAGVGALYGDVRPRLGAVGTWLATGNLALLLGALAYYIAYDIPLGVGQTQIRLALAGLVGATALLAVPLRRRGRPGPAPLVAAGLLFLAVPLALLGPDGVPPPTSEAGDGVRVATYNVHSAYDIAGRQDPAAIAETIEATGAEVVGLQEVSRGWLLNGSTDLVSWLADRLGMPHVAFHATTEDPLWGNAILSRRPLDDVRTGLLPTLDTLLPRGWMAAEVDVGGSPVTFVNTHLHHVGDLETLHTAQLTALLEQVEVAERTVLVGDLNARPDYPQLDLLRDAGLRDAWEEADGQGPGFTSDAADPQSRIDWVWVSDDLDPTDVAVTSSPASDHLPVSVTVR